MLKRMFLSILLMGVGFSANAMLKNAPQFIDYCPKREIVIASSHGLMFTLYVARGLWNELYTIEVQGITSLERERITLKSHPLFTPAVESLKEKIAIWTKEFIKEQRERKKKH